MIILAYISGLSFIHDYFVLYVWVINLYMIILFYISGLSMCTRLFWFIFLCYQYVHDYFGLYFWVINCVYDYFGLYFCVINLYMIILAYISALSICT